MKIQIRRLVLRYGVFALLALMSAGILYFVCSFEIRVKAPIHLFYDGNGHCWKGYLSAQGKVSFQPHDTLRVVQTPAGDFTCIVESVAVDPGMLRLTLRPVRKYTLPDTYCEGFVFVGKERIMDKILSRKLSL